jgi:energy-coupling factor transporter ATP-binding protein EcfA2
VDVQQDIAFGVQNVQYPDKEMIIIDAMGILR